jgi:hypothetical protein
MADLYVGLAASTVKSGRTHRPASTLEKRHKIGYFPKYQVY